MLFIRTIWMIYGLTDALSISQGIWSLFAFPFFFFQCTQADQTLIKRNAKTFDFWFILINIFGYSFFLTTRDYNFGRDWYRILGGVLFNTILQSYTYVIIPGMFSSKKRWINLLWFIGVSIQLLMSIIHYTFSEDPQLDAQLCLERNFACENYRNGLRGTCINLFFFSLKLIYHIAQYERLIYQQSHFKIQKKSSLNDEV